MSEWWTYTLSDFLLFSPRTYYRLFEIYNVAIWPAQIVAFALALVLLALVWRRRVVGRPAILAILAILTVCWLWVAVVFLAHRYATINWAAVYFAWGFGLQSVLLLISCLGLFRTERAPEAQSLPGRRAGMAILLFALLVEPFAGVLFGRGWMATEIFGLAPDPTAIATLGILLVAPVRRRGYRMVIPLIWCAISGATLLAMKSPDAWVPIGAAALAGEEAFRQSRALRRIRETAAS